MATRGRPGHRYQHLSHVRLAAGERGISILCGRWSISLAQSKPRTRCRKPTASPRRSSRISRRCRPASTYRRAHAYQQPLRWHLAGTIPAPPPPVKTARPLRSKCAAERRSDRISLMAHPVHLRPSRISRNGVDQWHCSICPDRQPIRQKEPII